MRMLLFLLKPEFYHLQIHIHDMDAAKKKKKVSRNLLPHSSRKEVDL